MNIRTFCRCSLFPSWSGYGLISTPVKLMQLLSNICKECSKAMQIVDTYMSNNFRITEFVTERLERLEDKRFKSSVMLRRVDW